jgi:hypothetical protein
VEFEMQEVQFARFVVQVAQPVVQAAHRLDDMLNPGEQVAQTPGEVIVRQLVPNCMHALPT